MTAAISVVAEGPTDRAVAEVLVARVGAVVKQVFVGPAPGKDQVTARLKGYNEAARHSPWLVVVDLDRDFDCAPAAVDAWLPEPAPGMCLRVAVRSVEAWLLADRTAVARFLKVEREQVPSRPDELADPKAELISLARRSRSRHVRERLVPRDGSGQRVGAEYASSLVAFARGHWDPERAHRRSPSLGRAITGLERLIGGGNR